MKYESRKEIKVRELVIWINSNLLVIVIPPEENGLILDYSFFGLQNSAEDNKEQHKDTLMTLSSKLLSIAKRHEAYQTMWSICCDLDDSELLQSLMV